MQSRSLIPPGFTPSQLARPSPAHPTCPPCSDRVLLSCNLTATPLTSGTVPVQPSPFLTNGSSAAFPVVGELRTDWAIDGGPVPCPRYSAANGTWVLDPTAPTWGECIALVCRNTLRHTMRRQGAPPMVQPCRYTRQGAAACCRGESFSSQGLVALLRCLGHAFPAIQRPPSPPSMPALPTQHARACACLPHVPRPLKQPVKAQQRINHPAGRPAVRPAQPGGGGHGCRACGGRGAGSGKASRGQIVGLLLKE